MAKARRRAVAPGARAPKSERLGLRIRGALINQPVFTPERKKLAI
jgi:hypothetical protein